MSLKPLEVRVQIIELPALVEKKSKEMDLNDIPEPMSLPIILMTYLSNFQSNAGLFCLAVFFYGKAQVNL